MINDYESKGPAKKRSKKDEAARANAKIVKEPDVVVKQEPDDIKTKIVEEPEMVVKQEPEEVSSADINVQE